MNISIRKAVIAAVAMLSIGAGVASANEVVLTSSEAKANSRQVALDIVSDGNAAGFQLSVLLDPSAKANAKIDLSKCLVDLPKTHQGSCVYRPASNDILVLVYSMSGATLPKGVVGIGTISGPSLNSKAVKVSDTIFASPLGKEL